MPLRGCLSVLNLGYTNQVFYVRSFILFLFMFWKCKYRAIKVGTYISIYIFVYILYMYLDTSNIYASYVSLLNVAASGDALKTLHLLPRCQSVRKRERGRERARVCDSFATWWILVALKAISTPISHRFKVVLVSIRMAFKQSFLKQTHKHTHTNTRTLTHTWLSALECLCLSIKIVNGETRTITRTRMRTHQRSA